jgi:hypothetical protein
VADIAEHPAGFIPNKRPISPKYAAEGFTTNNLDFVISEE